MRWLLLAAGLGAGLVAAGGVGCEGSEGAATGTGGQGGGTDTSTTGGGGFVPDCGPAPAPPSEGSCVVLTTTSVTVGVGGGGGAGGAASGGGGGGGGGIEEPVVPEVQCNPVAGGDCPEDEACDVALVAGVQAGLRCAPPPNRAPLCAPCDPVSGPFCVPGATCVEGSCTRFCCVDEDCPDGTACSTQANGSFRFSFASALGLCL